MWCNMFEALATAVLSFHARLVEPTSDVVLHLLFKGYDRLGRAANCEVAAAQY